MSYYDAFRIESAFRADRETGKGKGNVTVLA
nr:MAG TPA: hypothetical protein [Caudoviricetes sp.]